METQTVQRRFETEEQVVLDLMIPGGRIEVEAGQVDLTTVELSAMDERSETANVIDEATVEVRDRRGARRLVVHVSGRRFGSRAQVLLRVTCPPGRELDASTASADVETHGPLGSVEVKTASGDVNVDVVGGKLDVKTASGEVSVASVHEGAKVDSASGSITLGRIGGDGRIRVASGDVDVREADGSLSVHSASGDVLVGAALAGEIDLKTASGDLSVGVRQGSTVRVDARSMSGRMESDIALGDGPVEAADDAPHLDLRAVSMSGNVRITRA